MKIKRSSGNIFLFMLLFVCQSVAQGTVKGHVEDRFSGESLIGANVIWAKDDKILKGTVTDLNGNFLLSGLDDGAQTLHVRYLGYETETVEVRTGEQEAVLIKLATTDLDFPTVEITGASPTATRWVHGAATRLTSETIQLVRPLGTQEALTQVPGIHGFADDGMENSRISIGIRGLYPRRSSRVLILEDGVPIQPAIYVYPNAYYNPPVERIEDIEIVKGSGAIKYGPQTMGGVINYITKRPRNEFGGTLQLSGGMHGFASAFFEIGGWGNHKFHPELQLIYKRGDGYRDNNTFNQINGTFKLNWFPSTRKSVYLKLNVNHELSNATYTGLTQYSFLENPFFNPKENDEFRVLRAALDIIYTHEISAKVLSKTTGFVSFFDRDWWRENDVFITAGFFNSEAYTPGMLITPDQYANTAQQLTGDIVRVGNGEDNFGILREFFVAGAEQQYKWKHNLFGNRSDLNIGARAYFERFKDNFKFGFSPVDREGVHYYEDTILVDGIETPRLIRGKSHHYETYALSIFAEEKVNFGKLSLSPGIRFELFEQERVDRLQNSALRDQTNFAILPGIGFNYSLDKYNLFGGIHRGFTPPSSGTLTVLNFGEEASDGFDLTAEKSWNFELGARGNLSVLDFETSLFLLYIEDLVAAGRNTSFQNLGKVYTSGLEASFKPEIICFGERPLPA